MSRFSTLTQALVSSSGQVYHGEPRGAGDAQRGAETLEARIQHHEDAINQANPPQSGRGPRHARLHLQVGRAGLAEARPL